MTSNTTRERTEFIKSLSLDLANSDRYSSKESVTYIEHVGWSTQRSTTPWFNSADRAEDYAIDLLDNKSRDSLNFRSWGEYNNYKLCNARFEVFISWLVNNLNVSEQYIDKLLSDHNIKVFITIGGDGSLVSNASHFKSVERYVFDDGAPLGERIYEKLKLLIKYTGFTILDILMLDDK